MMISKDSMAILLLCSNLALANRRDLKPLTPGEWRDISLALVKSPLKSPRGFFQSDPDDWIEHLKVDGMMATKIKGLLAYGGQLGMELEKLEQIGVWVTTRVEENYPPRLKDVLKHKSPLILFGAGDKSLFNYDVIAIVGSRTADQRELKFTARLAERCAKCGYAVISGGARGVDNNAESAAFKAGGKVVSISAGGFINNIKLKDYREAVAQGNLLLLTADNPYSRFTVPAAMNRNKYIYGLANYAVVVSSGLNEGGTWAGAVENLKAGWTPVFVCNDMPKVAHRALMEKGAYPIVSVDLEKDLRQLFASPKSLQVEQVNESSDVYEVVYPILEKCLQIPRGVKEVAEMLNIRQGQAEDWLARGVEIDKIAKISKPARYIAKSALVKTGEQLSIDF
ncbi:DNA-processing protein DprA [Syntrophomonas wolfei]|jgi:predicted Rossmann fold nucleotide-binding protein DprA/Smf involved in DNA uptake|uniref:DNA-processing protein DprA n=1 Tax=Syntrophomonas wolfei TaxID=863 RepID=UPI0023F29CC3|nr:DNA-processing protein DprA [Syntrophomonas wolfei]